MISSHDIYGDKTPEFYRLKIPELFLFTSYSYAQISTYKSG